MRNFEKPKYIKNNLIKLDTTKSYLSLFHSKVLKHTNIIKHNTFIQHKRCTAEPQKNQFQTQQHCKMPTLYLATTSC
jgi:hypothetical protein